MQSSDYQAELEAMIATMKRLSDLPGKAEELARFRASFLGCGYYTLLYIESLERRIADLENKTQYLALDKDAYHG